MERPAITDLGYSLVYFLRGYAEVQSFISRTEGSYIFLALTGFVIQHFGFAPAIATVVSTQALASVATTLFLMLFFGTWTPYQDKKYLSKNLGAVVTLLISFGLFAVVTSQPLNNLALAGGQLAAGIIITFIGGSIYRYLHLYLDQRTDSVRTMIIVPGAVSLGAVAVLLLGISYGFRFFGAAEYLEIVKHTQGA